MTVQKSLSLPLLEGDRFLPSSIRREAVFGCCGARLLQQVHFWCETHPNTRDGEAWCYNTYEAWAEQVGYSVRQVKYTVKKLIEQGVLKIGNFNKSKYDRTLWYRLEYKAMEQLLVAAYSTVQPPPSPKCSPCTIKSAATARPIPEMNTEKNSYIGSASAKAVKTFLYPEEPTGKENREQEKLNKQESFVMSKKELLAIPANSDLPVKKHHNLAEQVGTGEMKIATAKELMAAQSAKDANTRRLPTLWLKHRYAVTGVCQKPLTVREMSQLKTFSKYMGERAEAVLRHTLENWWVFAAEAKAAAGLEKMPTEPEPGFLLKYCEHAMRLYLQSIAEPAKMVTKPAPVVTPAIPGVTYNNLGEEVYKPSQAEINAFFA